MRLIDSLKATYPDKEFVMDPMTGVIAFTSDGFSITDPFISECGRFKVSPTDEYGLDLEDAIAMFDHNMPLGSVHSNGPKENT